MLTIEHQASGFAITGSRAKLPPTGKARKISQEIEKRILIFKQYVSSKYDSKKSTGPRELAFPDGSKSHKLSSHRRDTH